MHYSKSTGGFYNAGIHTPAQIPPDAVEISDAVYLALLDGQSAGKVIAADANGHPLLANPPPPTAAEIIRQQIIWLESTTTSRKLREAVLGIDGGWLKGLDDQIVTLRAKL